MSLIGGINQIIKLNILTEGTLVGLTKWLPVLSFLRTYRINRGTLKLTLTSTVMNAINCRYNSSHRIKYLNLEGSLVGLRH